MIRNSLSEVEEKESGGWEESGGVSGDRVPNADWHGRANSLLSPVLLPTKENLKFSEMKFWNLLKFKNEIFNLIDFWQTHTSIH